MFFYTYVLFSLKDKKMYTGYTSDLDLRLVQHNKGNVVSTKDRRPLKLIDLGVLLLVINIVN
jgi:putative endonuclease